MKSLLLIIFMLTQAARADVTGKVNLSTAIHENREAITLKMQNLTKKDIYCSKIVTKIVYEDPQKYLPLEEVIYTHKDVFLRAGYDQADIVIDFASNLTAEARKKVPLAIINKVETLLSESNCEDASFYHYCQFAPKSRPEQQFLTTLSQRQQKYGCWELADLAADADKIDLRGLKVSSIRGLRYFYDLRSLDLSYNNITNSGEINYLPGIKQVYLNGNPLSATFDFFNLYNLERISLAHTKVNSLKNVNHLGEINWVDLYGTKIKTLKDFIPKRLKCIRFMGQHLTNQNEWGELVPKKKILPVCNFPKY